MWKFGSVEVCKCGSLKELKCGSLAAWKFGSVVVWKCGSLEKWKCGIVGVWTFELKHFSLLSLTLNLLLIMRMIVNYILLYCQIIILENEIKYILYVHIYQYILYIFVFFRNHCD